MSDPETHLCGSRPTGPHPYKLPEHDTWRVRPNGDRTCSYCGSLHPDDMLRLCKAAAEPGSLVQIERSDKDYKWYVRQPLVANASEGGIKFYAWHVPSEAWCGEVNAAIRAAQGHTAARAH